MRILTASCSRGQLKIQQMAFVLVALVVFFGLVFLIYASVRLNDVQNSAKSLEDLEAKELVRKFSSSAEFKWKGECASCVDLDKILVLKEKESYKEFWDLDYLMIENLDIGNNEECLRRNYPRCRKITIVEEPSFGTPSDAFVALCYFDSDSGKDRCDLGKIFASGRNLG
jgi:hypothetical protein